MLTPEQAQKVKSQLLAQMDNFPEENRSMIKHKILSMTNEEVEEFIKQNKLAHLENPKNELSKEQCIFCKIIEGKISSFKIFEDKENLAILEINPLSEGHTLVLPKEHLTEKIPLETEELAKKVALILETKLKPSKIEISPNNLFGHNFIEVIPIYGSETKRKKATEEQLAKIREKLLKEEIRIEKEISAPPKIIEKLPRLKPRIP